MRKNIAEDKEKLKEKLSYIGLNLERLPKFLTEFNPFSFRKSLKRLFVNIASLYS